MEGISKPIEEFLTFLRETEQMLRISEAEEQETNDLTQDILHSMELEEHDYRSLAELSKKLRDVRRRRRSAKDRICAVLPVAEWADGNRSVIKSIERLLGDVRKAERVTENRIYTPRAKK